MKTGPVLTVLLAFSAAAACKQSDGTEEASDQKSPVNQPDDQADPPAPVAGAYLTCLVAKPKANDTYLNAGCQLRNPTKVKVDCKSLPKRLWTYVPPKGVAVDPKSKPAIEVFDLCNDTSKNYYFQVGMRMKIASPSGTGLALAGGTLKLGSKDLALVESQRQKDAQFFLGLKPAVVFNASAKGGSSLGLQDAPTVILTQFNLQRETERVIKAQSDSSNEVYIPKSIIEAAADNGKVISTVFDPTSNKVQASSGAEEVLPTSTPVASVEDLPPAEKQQVTAAEGTTSSDTVLDPSAANDPYFTTAFDPAACSEAKASLKARLANHEITADSYTSTCDLYCDAASCTPPTN